MHSAAKYISESECKEEGNPIEIIGALKMHGTGLEGKTLLPSVVRPESALYTKPMTSLSSMTACNDQNIDRSKTPYVNNITVHPLNRGHMPTIPFQQPLPQQINHSLNNHGVVPLATQHTVPVPQNTVNHVIPLNLQHIGAGEIRPHIGQVTLANVNPGFATQQQMFANSEVQRFKPAVSVTNNIILTGNAHSGSNQVYTEQEHRTSLLHHNLDDPNIQTLIPHQAPTTNNILLTGNTQSNLSETDAGSEGRISFLHHNIDNSNVHTVVRHHTSLTNNILLTGDTQSKMKYEAVFSDSKVRSHDDSHYINLTDAHQSALQPLVNESTHSNEGGTEHHLASLNASSVEFQTFASPMKAAYSNKCKLDDADLFNDEDRSSQNDERRKRGSRKKGKTGVSSCERKSHSDLDERRTFFGGILHENNKFASVGSYHPDFHSSRSESDFCVNENETVRESHASPGYPRSYLYSNSPRSGSLLPVVEDDHVVYKDSYRHFNSEVISGNEFECQSPRSEYHYQSSQFEENDWLSFREPRDSQEIGNHDLNERETNFGGLFRSIERSRSPRTSTRRHSPTPSSSGEHSPKRSRSRTRSSKRSTSHVRLSRRSKSRTFSSRRSSRENERERRFRLQNVVSPARSEHRYERSAITKRQSSTETVRPGKEGALFVEERHKVSRRASRERYLNDEKQSTEGKDSYKRRRTHMKPYSYKRQRTGSKSPRGSPSLSSHRTSSTGDRLRRSYLSRDRYPEGDISHKPRKKDDDLSDASRRALKCFCLPQPHVKRTFVYEKRSNACIDEANRVHKEFEELLSKEKALANAEPPTISQTLVSDDCTRSDHSDDDTRFVHDLLHCDDANDNDVSESDIEFDGSDSDSSAPDDPVTKRQKFREQDSLMRLHSELWYNVKGEVNQGKKCLCSVQDQKKWIVHDIYPDEKLPEPCKTMEEDELKHLHHYWITVYPHSNFMTENPTKIQCNGNTYIFEGFSLLSHSSLDAIPKCFFTRFNFEYEILFIEEPVPNNFDVRDLHLFSRFLFHDVLELYDWTIGQMKDQDSDSCDLFYFLPRFTRRISENDDGREEYELLSMTSVWKYLLESHKPLISEEILSLEKGLWNEYVDSCVNSIVMKPGWKPSSIRVDDIERTNKGEAMIVHKGIRPVQLSFSGHPKCRRLKNKYLKLRSVVQNNRGVSKNERLRLVKLKLTLDNMKMKDSLRRSCYVRVSARDMVKTGLNSDVTQHAMVLPVLVHHVRFHLSLFSLDKRLAYTFKDRSLLQLALTHPSYVMNYGTNADHARNTLSNCGVKEPRYADKRQCLSQRRKKGIVQLINTMSKLEDLDGSHSFIHHNERLEFLGDAILEFICTSHLYFLFPDLAEGGLVAHRSSLVQNKHLTHIAKKLQLDNYMLFSHGPDLCHKDDMNHAMANCLEALLGAVYLDSGIGSVQKVFCELVFEETELRKLWCVLPKHPLQEQEPAGDRHIIPSSEFLKGLVSLEESIGVRFNHIRLLARAFTHAQVGFNNLTLGDNQRMELLGDSIVQCLVTDYLYRHFPQHHEGHLTLLRSSLVNRNIQAQIATEVGLDRYIHFGSGPVVPNLKKKNLSDLFEAFLAALFVDKGIEPVEVFCKVCLFPRLRDVIINQEWLDAKSQLQSCCIAQSKHNKLPVYKVVNSVGSANVKHYTVAVYFDGKRLATGSGNSIHEAEMNAAIKGLEVAHIPEKIRQKIVRKKSKEDTYRK